GALANWESGNRGVSAVGACPRTVSCSVRSVEPPPLTQPSPPWGREGRVRGAAQPTVHPNSGISAQSRGRRRFHCSWAGTAVMPQFLTEYCPSRDLKGAGTKG